MTRPRGSTTQLFSVGNFIVMAVCVLAFGWFAPALEKEVIQAGHSFFDSLELQERLCVGFSHFNHKGGNDHGNGKEF